MEQKTIGHPIKELIVGKAAITGLMRQVIEEVREAEKQVEKNTEMLLLEVIKVNKAFLEGITQGLIADRTEARRILRMCKAVLGEEVEEDIGL